MSATDLFNMKYSLCSSALLRDYIVSHGLKAPKWCYLLSFKRRSSLQRKKTVISILDHTLKEEFSVLQTALNYS